MTSFREIIAGDAGAAGGENLAIVEDPKMELEGLTVSPARRGRGSPFS
jgi:hypothetical protein